MNCIKMHHQMVFLSGEVYGSPFSVNMSHAEILISLVVRYRCNCCRKLFVFSK